MGEYTMLKFRESAVLDRNAEALGMPTHQLMENAGKAVAETVFQRTLSGSEGDSDDGLEGLAKTILILCGTGNNGGDGFVATRHLAKRGCTNIEVVLLAPAERIKTVIAKANFDAIPESVTVNVDPIEAGAIELIRNKIAEADLIIDAMLGVGVTGTLRGIYLYCVEAINARTEKVLDVSGTAKANGFTVVSVDIATGLGTSTALKPDLTVTFHDIKEGMNRENSGEIIVADIGFPRNAELFTGPGELAYYPKPRSESYKGKNGRVLVVGGGPYTGAPALAGMAAYRVGVDLVRIAVPHGIFPIIASYSPNFIVHPLTSEHRLNSIDISTIQHLLPKVDSLVIGPGLGSRPETKEAVMSLISKCTVSSKHPIPLVIDASAIDAVAEDLTSLDGCTGVITPHAGEFKKLTGDSLPEPIEERVEVIRESAERLGLTIVLKGAVDIISDGVSVKRNRTGNPGMTVGGTGDVLAGVIGGILAKGPEPFNAGRIGAFINGYSGDLAFEEMGYSLTATDIIECIPKTLKEFL